MYDELYAAWRREIEEASLGGLPPDFYARVADYLGRIREENRLLDKKSVRVNLLDREAQNVKWMLEQLLHTRYKKMVKTITRDQKLPSELLTTEEAKMCESFITFSVAYKKFTKGLVHGQNANLEADVGHKRVTLRFVKSTPAIIGLDLKTYGPFTAEDVASLPAENAKILVRQGLAVLVAFS